ncbi:histone-lysine N-methyltransferase SETMAR [Trichonephila clavipes]|nr:histone-lysine N-methyltransferase SETMAR [Trichonephila clavipes]
MHSARDQCPSLPIDVLGISLQRVPHVEAWRVGCHLSSPPRHSTGVPNDTVCIFDVKDAPRTSRPVVENVDKITEIIEVVWHVSSRSIAQGLKIEDHKTVLSPLRKVGFKKKLHVWVPHQFTPKKHDGSNFHLQRLGQTERNQPIS